MIIYPLEEEKQPGNEQQSADEPLPDERIENEEAHKKSHSHIKKFKDFQQYQELYLTKILPCLTKEEELRKKLHDSFLSGKGAQVALDLESLEEIRSSVTSEVQTIESSLDWTNCSSLITAINNFQHKLQKTERIVEQGESLQIQGKSCRSVSSR